MRFLTVIFLLLISFIGSAQTIVGRQLQITLNTGDGTYPTTQGLLWLPDDYDETEITYPLIISLGGEGQASSNINKLLDAGQLAKYIANGWNPVATKDGITYKFIVYSPLGPPNTWGWSTQINTFITQLKSTYRVNANQIYLTGLSRGGWGVQQAFTSSTTVTNITAATIISPGDYVQGGCDNMAAANTPVWVISRTGEAYNVSATNAYNRLIAQGSTAAVRTAAAGSAHDIWGEVYDHTKTWSDLGGKNWFDWLIQFGDADAPVPCGNVIDLNSLRPGGDSTGKTFNSGNGFAPCDTLELHGKWTYVTFSHIHGTPQKHIVIRNKLDSIVNITNGFSFDSCSYIDVIGQVDSVPGVDTTYYLRIHDDVNKSSPGVTFTGLCKNTTVSYTEIYNKTYGVWAKWESNQTGCDSTQWFPHKQDSIGIYHNYIHEIGQEGLYSGSTDPLGTAPERAVTCWDSTFTPRSAAESNIFVMYNKVRNTGRTGLQVSAVQFGKFKVNYNDVRNSGRDDGLTQWPNIWIGSSSTEGEVIGNILDSATRDNITCYGNLVEIADNICKHNGVARDWANGTIKTYNYYNNITFSRRATVPNIKSQFNIHDNNVTNQYPVTANNVWIEGNASDYATSGNYICSSGAKVNMQNSIPLEDCGDEPDPDPIGPTSHAGDDISITLPELIHLQGSYTEGDGEVVLTEWINEDGCEIEDPSSPDTWASCPSGVHIFTFHIEDDNDLSANDNKIVTVNSSPSKKRTRYLKFGEKYLKIKITTGQSPTDFGIFVSGNGDYNTLALQLNRAHSLAVPVFRYNYTYGNTYRLKQCKDSGMKVQLTFNYNAINSGNGYAEDPVAFKNALRATLLSITEKPDYICIRNEPSNSSYWDTANPINYVINELVPAAELCDSLGIPVSDGGFLPGTVFNLWKYYQDNGITDSLQTLQDTLANYGITGINNSIAQAYIKWNGTVLNGISEIPKLKYVNQHLNEPWGDTTGITKSTGIATLLMNYIAHISGKKVWSNEFHTSNHSTFLLKRVINDMLATKPELLIYFAGDTYPSGNSIDLAEAYAEYIQQIK